MQDELRPLFNLVDLAMFSVTVFFGFAFIMSGLMTGEMVFGTILGVGVAGTMWRFYRLAENFMTPKKTVQDVTKTPELTAQNETAPVNGIRD